MWKSSLLLILIACGDPAPVSPDARAPLDARPALDRHVLTASGFSCAYRVGGAPTCWGDNAWGQLGSPDLTDHLVPFVLDQTVEAIAIGTYRSCAIHRDATVWCWGGTGYGLLGDGTPTGNGMPHPVPTLVSTTSSLVALRMGSLSTCGLTATGLAQCWGHNFDGELANGSRIDAVIPTWTTAYRGEHVADAAMFRGTLLVDGDGHAETFGMALFGASTITSVPDAVRYVYTGVSGCALRANGEVWCVGRNDYGVVGVAPTGETCSGVIPAPCISQPVRVPLPEIVDLYGGGQNVCALTASGDAYCWGDNRWGTLGNGTLAPSFAPVSIALPGGRAIVELAVAGQICALASDQSVWCWGHNEHGEVGDGTRSDRASPVQIAVRW